VIDQALLDLIADIEAVLEDAATYATGIEANQAKYELLRKGLMSNPRAAGLVPEFLIRHKALGQVRRHFQNQSRHYAERRQQLRDDLESLYLLATGRAASAGPGANTASPSPGISGVTTPTAVAPLVRRDVFLSHASEDKQFARELVAELEKLGFSVWFDEYELLIGDNVANSVTRGLQNASYGVVILSPSFLAKKWTDAELNAMFSLGVSGGEMVILPVLYQLSHGELVAKYPLIGSLLALDAGSLGAAGIAVAIARRVERDNRATQ
jgi:hypothetical protein